MTRSLLANRSLLRNITLVIIVSFCLVLFSGCLPFPLGDPEKSQVDVKLSGFWLNEHDDMATLVSLYPYDQHTYVAECIEYKRDNSATRSHDLYKAWITPVKGQTFLTLDALAQHQPSFEPDKR